MSNVMLSIIVPVYNVEQYIGKCIESIVNQTYKNLEIILVDDGSTDNSGKICDEWARKDKRIKVYHKENGGVSEARNLGIKKSTGEYITFVDSDDDINTDFVDIVIKNIKKEKYDYIAYNVQKYNENTRYIEYKNMLNTSKLSKTEYIDSIISIYYSKNKLKGIYGPSRCIGGKVFRRKIIEDNKIFFDKEIYIMEDGIFILEFLSHASSILLNNKAIYNYRQIATSTSFRYNNDQLEQYNLILKKFKEYKKNKNDIYNKLCLELLSTYIYRLYLTFPKYKQFQKQYSCINKKCPEIIPSVEKSNYKYLKIKHKMILFAVKHKYVFSLFLFSKMKTIIKNKRNQN